MNATISRRTWIVAALLLTVAFIAFYLTLPSLTPRYHTTTASGLKSSHISPPLKTPQPSQTSSPSASMKDKFGSRVGSSMAGDDPQSGSYFSRDGRPKTEPAASNAQVFERFFEHIRKNQQNQPEELKGIIDDFLAEDRDARWASQVETSIRSEVDALKRKHGAGLDVQSVECRATLCLVGVVMPASQQGSPYEWQKTLSGMNYERSASFNFSNSYTTMAAADNNRIVYLSYLIR